MFVHFLFDSHIHLFDIYHDVKIIQVIMNCKHTYPYVYLYGLFKCSQVRV